MKRDYNYQIFVLTYRAVFFLGLYMADTSQINHARRRQAEHSTTIQWLDVFSI